MVGRKGGISGKQKSALLKDKRAKNREREDGERAAAAAEDISDAGVGYIQQVSKKGVVNHLSTRFVRDDDASVGARKSYGGEPFAARLGVPLVCTPAAESLGLPRRPETMGTSATAQEEAEDAAFEAWLAGVHGRASSDSLSPFEHNLEVWRQLWRVLERSDVVCIVSDVRNPLLHVPTALYQHITTLDPPRRLVIVLSKVDLIDENHLERWRDTLQQHFPRAILATFSSKGRPVGGTTGGGIAARRKSIHAAPTMEEKRLLREYAEGVAAACGVERPPPDEAILSAGAIDQSDDEAIDQSDDEAEACESAGDVDEEGLVSEDEGQASEEDEGARVQDDKQRASAEDECDCEDDESILLRRMVAAGRLPQRSVIGHALDKGDAGGTCSEVNLDANGALHRSLADAHAADADAPRERERTEAVGANDGVNPVTIGFVGHPNVGKSSLLNAIVGRKVASVSRTPGHTKHLQTWQLTPTVTICDSPGLVFPVAGALVDGVDVGARAVYESCGLFPLAQIREPYSAIRLLHASQDLIQAFGLQHSPELRDEAESDLSPYLFATALAERRGYRIARGRGALDLHRAGLEVLRDCIDGAICLAFDPPKLSEMDVQKVSNDAALLEVLAELKLWADAQDV